MADYRRYDVAPRHHEFDLSDRASDEVRSDDRAYGMYRTDDRSYHDRYRHEHIAHNPEARGDQDLPTGADGIGSAPWGPRERGGYWRRYEAARPHLAGRGPKGLQTSGTGTTSSQHVTEASGKGTPSKSTSGTSA